MTNQKAISVAFEALKEAVEREDKPFVTAYYALDQTKRIIEEKHSNVLKAVSDPFSFDGGYCTGLEEAIAIIKEYMEELRNEDTRAS